MFAFFCINFCSNFSIPIVICSILLPNQNVILCIQLCLSVFYLQSSYSPPYSMCTTLIYMFSPNVSLAKIASDNVYGFTIDMHSMHTFMLCTTFAKINFNPQTKCVCVYVCVCVVFKNSKTYFIGTQLLFISVRMEFSRRKPIFYTHPWYKQFKLKPKYFRRRGKQQQEEFKTKKKKAFACYFRPFFTSHTLDVIRTWMNSSHLFASIIFFFIFICVDFYCRHFFYSFCFFFTLPLSSSPFRVENLYCFQRNFFFTGF